MILISFKSTIADAAVPMIRQHFLYYLINFHFKGDAGLIITGTDSALCTSSITLPASTAAIPARYLRNTILYSHCSIVS